MATALLPTRPSLLAGAIVLRPLSPFRHGLPTRTDGTPALIIDGERNRRRFAAMVFGWSNGWTATAMHHFLPVGHWLTARNGKIAVLGVTGSRPRRPVARDQPVPL